MQKLFSLLMVAMLLSSLPLWGESSVFAQLGMTAELAHADDDHDDWNRPYDDDDDDDDDDRYGDDDRDDDDDDRDDDRYGDDDDDDDDDDRRRNWRRR